MNNHTRHDTHKEVVIVPGTPDSVQRLVVVLVTTTSIQEVVETTVIITFPLPRYLSNRPGNVGEDTGHPIPFL